MEVTLLYLVDRLHTRSYQATLTWLRNISPRPGQSLNTSIPLAPSLNYPLIFIKGDRFWASRTDLSGSTCNIHWLIVQHYITCGECVPDNPLIGIGDPGLQLRGMNDSEIWCRNNSECICIGSCHCTLLVGRVATCTQWKVLRCLLVHHWRG